MFIPHVGQEVIVMFEEGDPDRPLVTGRVYNAEQMPPVELPGGKTQSIIRDHGGNEIIMEGAAGGQQMRLHSPTHDTTVLLGSSVNIATQSDYKVRNNGNTSWNTLGEWQQNILGNYKIEVAGDVLSVMLGWKHDTVVGARTELSIGEKLELTLLFLQEMILGWKYELDPKGHKKAAAKEQKLLGWIEHKVGEVRTDLGIVHENVVNLNKACGTEFRKVRGQLTEDIAAMTRTIAGAAVEDLGSLEQKIKGAYDMMASKCQVKSSGDIILNSDGSVSITAGSEVTIACPTLKLNGKSVSVKDGTLKVE
jgi:hypothetical protein